MTRSGACSAPSPARAGGEANEDAWRADDVAGLWAVADGLGGHRGGAVASRLVLEVVGAALAGPAPAEVEAAHAWLRAAAVEAARRLHARGKETGLGSMATTLTVVKRGDGAWHLLHVGDSRAYLLADGELAQLTRDHTIAWEQHEAGAFAKDAVRTHSNKRLLTRTLIARTDHVVADARSGALPPGARLLLVTDGVWNALPDAALAAAVAGDAPPDRLAEEVVARARSAGADDDATALVVQGA